jgi:hypothetical protein
MFKFRMGDIFDADDPLAVWLCILAIGFNDAIHATIKFTEAERSWAVLYEWRVMVSHFNEACLHLERGRGVTEVEAFLEAEGLSERLDELLSRYDALRHITNRIRNETTFHYPHHSGQQAVAEALRQIANEDEFTGSYGPSSKIRHSRQLFADQVVAALVMNASGGTRGDHERVLEDVQEAIGSLGRFANKVLDAYFARRVHLLQKIHPADVPSERL